MVGIIPIVGTFFLRGESCARSIEHF